MPVNHRISADCARIGFPREEVQSVVIAIPIPQEKIAEESNCSSVFKNGAEAPTSEGYTQKWIELINLMEGSRQTLSANCGGGVL